jgi:capsular exopolysaccharide synthesis family protein
MEIRVIFSLLRRWAWLLILGAAVGAAIGYAINTTQDASYQSSTRIMVVSMPENASSRADIYSLAADQRIAEAYVELLTTRPVLDAVEEKLGFRVNAGQISVSQPQNQQIILIRATDSVRDRTALIADTLVDVFIDYNETLQVGRFASSEDTLSAQLSQVEQQIADAEASLQDLSEINLEETQAELDIAVSDLDARVANLQREIIELSTESGNGNEIALIEKRLELEKLRSTYQTYQDVYLDAIQAGNVTAQSSAETELTALESQIIALETEIFTITNPETDLETQLLIATKQSELEQLKDTRDVYLQLYLSNSLTDGGDLTRSEQIRANQVQTNLDLYQRIYSSLLASYESIRLARLQNTPNVVQIEEPEPGQLIPSQPLVLLGAVVGLLIAAAIAFVIEYLDDTIKTPADVQRVTNLPTIGYIAESDALSTMKSSVFIAANPRSPVAEAFRSLRTNLEFAEVDHPVRTILISSPGPSEGKTTLATNLAVSIGQGGKRALLLDVDLRRPRVHKALNLSNAYGLSDLLRGSMEINDVLQPTESTNMMVITTGTLPPNPTELLNSERMSNLLEKFLEQFDMVVLDSAPFIVTDPLVLAAKVDGVILSIRPGHTTIPAARAAVEQLKRAEAYVLGVVLSRISRKGTRYYGGYRYSYPYYYDSTYDVDPDDVPKKGRKANAAYDKKRNGFIGRLRRTS